MGIRQGKSVPGTLDEAIERQVEAAARLGLVPKKMADLMGVEVKTYYRWLAESSMPLNRVRQFEAFCKASHISEYLCTAQGSQVVVSIPMGKKAAVADMADVQINAANAIALLARFYQDKDGLAETVAALTTVLSQVAYHRENVMKTGEPELELFEE